jgi:TonB-dependent receptor
VNQCSYLRHRRAAAMRCRPSAVATACAVLFLASGARAQTTPSETPPAPAAAASAPEAAPPAPAAAASAPVAQPAAPAAQTIVVQGIRASLGSSLNLKRNAQGVVDGIVAEDIGKFPDTNLAEALQRISGVSIDRQNGEGQRVTVRGVGAEFNMVLLNGRQMPASNIEPTAPSSSRAFDFANLATESVSALEVFKTSRASSPTGGLGAVINIKTARPFDNPGLQANIGIKGVYDKSNSRLPDSLQGKTITPDVSGIYSNTFADGKLGIALTGSYQERDSGFNEAGVPNGWRAFGGSEGGWGTIPQPGAPGSQNIINRPGPTDTYSVPQNINYSVNGVRRQRTNGQLTLQFAPMKELVGTLDYTYSEYKAQTRRNELSAWFNFGPSSSSWTNGPVSSPRFYSETINPPNSDIAMGGAQFATKNKNGSLGLNLAWKASDKLKLEFDAHKSSGTSGPDSPYGSNSSLGTASLNRGTTSVDFTRDFPVLSIEGSTIDASRMLVTGSSFRNSYMKSEVEQAQFKGNWRLDEDSQLDFGVGLTKVKNRSAYGFVQNDTWGGLKTPADYPDSAWTAADIRPYFNRINGSNDPALFNQFFLWDFETVRNLAVQADGDPAKFRAPTTYTNDRRVREKSQSLFLQYSKDWELGVPMSASIGGRYEKTDVASPSLVPNPTGLRWVSNNEYAVDFGAPLATTRKGSYKYFLPSIDFDADLTDNLKFRASYGETIGRPGWGAIQGGVSVAGLGRQDGLTGDQGSPGLKPLKSKNFDLSLEYYYAKASFVAVGLFQKNVENFIGFTRTSGTPFNARTPANGVYFQEAVTLGGCPASDLTCIRNWIFLNRDGQPGVTRGAPDANGNQTGTIAAQPGDPLVNVSLSVPINQRSDRIKGAEFNVQHMFGNSGFGVAANFTYVDSGLKTDNKNRTEQYALPGLSNSANLVGFYENDQWSVRLAYNWRDEFLRSQFDSERPNPVYTEAYGQLDVNVGYKVTPSLTLQGEIINLNDGIQRSHGRAGNEQLVAVTQSGPRYMLGLRYKF